MATILVVDDEPRIVQLVRDYLEHGGFTVLVASDGPSALRSVRTGRPDLVVLDLGLPGIDGLDVARALRREGDVPIIMLTARTEESDKLVGLELGADDYLTKPFSPKELVLRIKAILRRGRQGDRLSAHLQGYLRRGPPHRRPQQSHGSARNGQQGVGGLFLFRLT